MSRISTAPSTSPSYRLTTRPLRIVTIDVAEFQQLLQLGGAKSTDQSARRPPRRSSCVDRRAATDVHAARRLVQQQTRARRRGRDSGRRSLLLVPAAQGAHGIVEPALRPAAQFGEPERRRAPAPTAGPRHAPRTCGRRVASRFQAIGLSRNSPSDLRSLETNAIPRRAAAPDPAGTDRSRRSTVPAAAADAARRRRAARRTRRCRVARPARRSGRARGEREVLAAARDRQPRRSAARGQVLRRPCRPPASRCGGSPSICTMSESTVRSAAGVVATVAVAQHRDVVAELQHLPQPVRHEDDRAARGRDPCGPRRTPTGSRRR